MWLYYHGRNWRHGERPAAPRSGAIGRVRMRLDGFACQEARPGGGELLTPPLRFCGSRLAINLDAGAGGRMKVEVCDAEGRPIPGHTAAEADWQFFNDVRRIVTWQGSPELPRLPQPVVRLRFIGANARLYAFQFLP
jgi:hypothetical protein